MTSRPRPQPWYTSLNPTPRSPRHGRNRRTSPPAHGRPVDRADPPDSTGPADDAADAVAQWGTSSLAWRTITVDLAKPKPPAIPYAGIRAGELIGYRLWLVADGGHLCSLAHHFIWEPGATIEGKVDEVVNDNLRFQPLFGGVYCFRDFAGVQDELKRSVIYPFPYQVGFPIDAQTYSVFTVRGIAWGTIKLWGEVIEHERGYRAQFAKLRTIDGAAGHYGSTELQGRYNV